MTNMTRACFKKVLHHISSELFQVSLWKESLEGQWVCVSDVNKGQGQISSQTPHQAPQTAVLS